MMTGSREEESFFHAKISTRDMFRVLEPKRMYDQADVKLQDMFEPTETRRLIRACEMEGLRSDEEALEFELM
jgi:hypothetical protein